MVDLLFGRPLNYGQSQVSLVFPANHLHRPIVARAADIPGFARQLLPLTLNARREPPGVGALVASMLRDDKRGPVFGMSGFGEVADRPGMSGATLAGDWRRKTPAFAISVTRFLANWPVRGCSKPKSRCP